MKAQGITSGIAFTRNPIILSGDWNYSPDASAGVFSLDMNDDRIYDGRFVPSSGIPSVRVDVSDMADAFSGYFPEVASGNTEPIVEVADNGELAGRVVSAYFDYDTVDGDFEFLAIPGGISHQNFRKHVEKGKDVFDSRFLADGCNFFFTTRTSGWKILIRETELAPLYFLAYGRKSRIALTELATGIHVDFGDLAAGIYAIDLSALRHSFFENHGVLPSAFDIERNGVFACRVIIGMADVVPERYRLKFRNSFGFFEIVEITDAFTVVPEYTEEENLRYRLVDPVTGELTTARKRVGCIRKLTTNIGPISEDMTNLFLDMLGSDEVWLLDFAPEPVKVIPLADSLSFGHRMTKPVRVPLTLTVAGEDFNITEDITDALETGRGHVFTKTFKSTFN